MPMPILFERQFADADTSKRVPIGADISVDPYQSDCIDIHRLLLLLHLLSQLFVLLDLIEHGGQVVILFPPPIIPLDITIIRVEICHEDD